jgi:HSP20 family protein
MQPPVRFGNVYGFKPFHQLFENVMNDAVQTQQEQVIRPSADILEDNEKFEVQLSLPGVKKEDIKIDVKDNILNISAEKSFTKSTEDTKVHLKEHFYGKIHRGFKLPKNVDQSTIVAHLENGVLQLTIQKLQVEKAEGCFIYGTDGKKYLDFVAGVSANTLGHSHPKIVDAIKKQADTLYFLSLLEKSLVSKKEVVLPPLKSGIDNVLSLRMMLI